MKLPSPQTIVLAVLLAAALKAGPDALHAVFGALTPEAQLAASLEEYERLVSSALTLEPEERSANLERRDRLALWFRVRGMEVDDQPRSESLWQPWSELIDYWKLPPE
jgi:hypothetical protein